MPILTPPNIHEIIPPRTLAMLTELIQRVKADGFGEVHILIRNGRIAFITETHSYNTEKEETPTECTGNSA